MLKSSFVYLAFLVLLAASFIIMRLTMHIAVDAQQWGLGALGGFSLFFCYLFMVSPNTPAVGKATAT